MLAQQGFPGGRITSGRRVIGCEQIAHEYRIVREALVRVLVQTQKKCGAAIDQVVEVAFQFTSLKTLHRIARQLLEFGIALVTQVIAGKLVVPGLVGKAGDGTTIDLLLLGAQPVLVEENRETLVKAGVIRVAINFAAQDAERERDLLHFHQACQVTLQHTRILGRTRDG